MTDFLLAFSLVLLLGLLVLQIVALLRRTTTDTAPLQTGLELSRQAQERTEKTLRDEIARNRSESLETARQGREELHMQLKSIGEMLHTRLSALTQANDEKLEKIRNSVEKKLESIQVDSNQNLEKMRQTVDEKLQGTLEKRLGESFKLIGERLENVHRGLGEMQLLANGVGDLKRVLTNVKVRGTWGEIQLGALLDQLLAREQYSRNVDTKGSGERVEFVVNLPGQGDRAGDVVWLPIDSKCPTEDYQRLIDAHDRADAEAAASAGKQLEAQIRSCAATISTKYLNPPLTTDFAIMFLPIEGLYAEVIQRTELMQELQRKYRVSIAGPTTLAALLNSLQMGFRTLAIQQRSSEVWQLLGAVKTEFAKYGDVLAKLQKKLQEASNQIDQAKVRTRAIDRKLREVEALPSGAAHEMLELEVEQESLDEETSRALSGND